MTWFYNNIEFTQKDVETYYGFVYLIENITTGKKYIGRKFFTKSGTQQIKGKKKKIRKQSDWMTYWSSSDEVKKDVQQYGKENFKRTILHLCKTRAPCSYWETYEIFTRNALLSEEYYNSWVSCKIHRAHLKGIICPENNLQIMSLKDKQPRLIKHSKLELMT
jgi:hypothetical protein